MLGISHTICNSYNDSGMRTLLGFRAHPVHDVGGWVGVVFSLGKFVKPMCFPAAPSHLWERPSWEEESGSILNGKAWTGVELQGSNLNKPKERMSWQAELPMSDLGNQGWWQDPEWENPSRGLESCLVRISQKRYAENLSACLGMVGQTLHRDGPGHYHGQAWLMLLTRGLSQLSLGNSRQTVWGPSEYQANDMDH